VRKEDAMRKCRIPDGRRAAPELSLHVHRAAGAIGVGVAARGWLAVSIVGLVAILLVLARGT
jgi:hypothetical protein